LSVDYIFEWAEEEHLAMLVEVIGLFPLSIWELCGVVLWSFGGRGGGGIDSCVTIVWTGNIGWTRGKGKYALEAIVWIGHGEGSIGHWLAPEEGLAGILPHPSLWGCTRDSWTLKIKGWGCKITLGGTWGWSKVYYQPRFKFPIWVSCWNSSE
jgi:hypothetical protein